MQTQLNLFNEILNAYSHAETPISNETLYRSIKKSLSLDDDVTEKKTPIGKSGIGYNLFKRKVRWWQQSLKKAGILQRIEGKRGEWCLTKTEKDELDKIIPTLSVIGFSTKLGVAIIGYAETVFKNMNEPIYLAVVSPPYPLKKPRKYGNYSEPEYVNWLCETMVPVIENLAPGGSICLNLGQDVFLKGTPARSMYIERLVLALHDRFNLHLADRLIWVNGSKPPGPIAWASKKRVHLNVGYEPIIWMTNDPDKLYSNNQRILLPHSEKHLDFIRNGGAKKAAIKSDGAYRLKEGSYSNLTEGKIQRNTIHMGHSCGVNRAYRKAAIEQGYEPHGATMPYKLAKMLIEFLTVPGQLVVDFMAGSISTGYAAEVSGRPWICVDPVVDYVMGGSSKFVNCEGFHRNYY